MLLRSGKTKGETEMPLSELSKFMELWLKESRKHDEQLKEEVHREEERRRYEESGDKRRKNGDGWKKRELEGKKRELEGQKR